jgi:hypothetical protein
MLHPTRSTLRSFIHSAAPAAVYRLSNVSLDITDSETAVFRAKLCGPAGSLGARVAVE